MRIPFGRGFRQRDENELTIKLHIALILAIVGICAPESFADCAPPAPFACSLPASPLAFLGTVISKQDVDLRPAPAAANRGGRRLAGEPPPSRDNSYIAVTFRVNEALRGDFEDTIVIRTDPANSSNSYRFEIAHDYLVFADLQNGHLYTNSCTGTRSTATEIAFIRELRAARRGSRMSDVFGLVTTRQAALDSVTPGPNLTVTAKSDAGEYRALTAADGTYEFHGLASGRYAITLKPPPMRELSHQYILDVGFQSACRADFELDYIGTIRGTVADGQGHPLAGIISAFPVGIDQTQSAFSAADVVEGHFELRHVPPGRYRIRFIPRVRSRIESYYYPGTINEAAAVEVEVRDGALISGLQFTIP